ncbi:YtkA-like protein [Thermolongibacillus altinsuensis]|uniref:YtkA-like protein n=1 Tax=Thermolongibacillus altinsuensis TaxID=575256 RepID=A0A4R1QNJ4_9BACL|nr:FixH family protein [Thermolongibacillus altinsuensis]TCL49243.1 YtkA-like protein [Thermolongibacillus altinsuensis]GMB08691.1 hypothetical protein B1no1_14010 [Thermolongibacillus altinsuensis]
MKKWLFLFGLLIVFLAGCASQNETEEELPFLDVKIVADEKVPLNKEVEIACLVTYGNEKVTDADEVKFEVWKNGTENHEMIEGKHAGGGKYVIRKTFTEAGTYSIVAHVTARSMHNMPKVEVTVE